jgi:hypothetical protein
MITKLEKFEGCCALSATGLWECFRMTQTLCMPHTSILYNIRRKHMDEKTMNESIEKQVKHLTEMLEKYRKGPLRVLEKLAGKR